MIHFSGTDTVKEPDQYISNYRVSIIKLLSLIDIDHLGMFSCVQAIIPAMTSATGRAAEWKDSSEPLLRTNVDDTATLQQVNGIPTLPSSDSLRVRKPLIVQSGIGRSVENLQPLLVESLPAVTTKNPAPNPQFRTFRAQFIVFVIIVVVVWILFACLSVIFRQKPYDGDYW